MDILYYAVNRIFLTLFDSELRRHNDDGNEVFVSKSSQILEIDMICSNDDTRIFVRLHFIHCL